MPRQRSTLGVDMFPFLSVLCCIIGVLMLFMMIVMSTRVTDAHEAAAQTEREAREQPANDAAEEGLEEKQYRELEQEILVLRGTLSGLHRERLTLQEIHDALRDQLELKKLELAEAERREDGRKKGAGLAERIPVRPKPREQGDYKKRPIYVEVRHDGLVLQPEKRSFPLQEFKKAGSPVQNFLAKTYKDRNEVYLTLLIHSDGMEVYQQLLDTLRSNKDYATVSVKSVSLGGATRNVETVKFHIDIATEPFSTDWVFEDPNPEKSANP